MCLRQQRRCLAAAEAVVEMCVWRVQHVGHFSVRGWRSSAGRQTGVVKGMRVGVQKS